jgi:uncharacterized membrane protein
MRRLNRFFLTGILVLLPLFLSIYILVLGFRFIDGILGNVVNIYIRKEWGFSIPGIGLILFFAIVIAAGLVSTYIGHKYLDKFFGKFPLIKYIYVPLKQMLEFIFSEENITFKKAVLIEFPCKGNWSMGFITNESFQEAKHKIAEDLVNIFVPLAPNPITGFIVFVRKADILFLDMEIREAMRLILSGGVLNPHEMTRR